MSRGGRGGGRGGRGGGAGGRPNVPWDTGEEIDGRPSELFPPYTVPTPRKLTPHESSSAKHFLLLRHQLHASPLYTSKRTLDPTHPRKMYGQTQTNALYGVRNKASQDPFTAMPTYGQRFVREDRALPDWSQRPVCRELFPAELLDVVDADTRGRKKRRLELSRVSALPNAEEAFGLEEEDGGKGLLEKLDALGDEEEVEGEVEEGAGEEDEEDEVYDDEDAGDYDAENYFDNGSEGGEDYGDDGGDGEGTF